jgi:two-component system response regulator CpxR
LLIDDDEKWCRVLSQYLGRHGYAVRPVPSGPKGVEAALSRPWDLVILDVMLPDIDGFEVLKRIRAKSAVPILILTARSDEADRIDGLDFGADDYLLKTFSMQELLARIRAVTRRGGDRTTGRPDPQLLQIGGLRIHLDAYRVFVGENEVILAPVEYALLVCLARAKGKVQSREALFSSISDRRSLTMRAVDVHVSTLRRKLGDSSERPRYIRTSRGHGYMLIDPSLP